MSVLATTGAIRPSPGSPLALLPTETNALSQVSTFLIRTLFSNTGKTYILSNTSPADKANLTNVLWILSSPGEILPLVFPGQVLLNLAQIYVDVDNPGDGVSVTYSDIANLVVRGSTPAGTNIIGSVGISSSIPLELAQDQVVSTITDVRMIGSQPVSLGRTDAASALPVVLANDQTPIPVVSDAGTPSQPIRIDPIGTTPQPVTIVGGAITVNQGTANPTPWNENLAQVGGSPIALGQGSSSASLPVVVAADQVLPTADDLRLVGSQPFFLGRTDSTGALPVVVASDQIPLPVVQDPSSTITANQGGGWTVSVASAPPVVQGSSPWVENIVQVGGAPLSLGQAPMAGSLPFALASDQVVPVIDDIRMIGSQPFALGKTDASGSIPVVLASDQTPVPVVSDQGTLVQPTRVDPIGTTPQPVIGTVSATQLGSWLISLIQNGQLLSAGNPVPVQLSDGVASYDLGTLVRIVMSERELQSLQASELISQTSLFIPQPEVLPFLGA